MKTPSKLDFLAMCKSLSTFSTRRNRNQKVETVINDELEELGRRIHEYGEKGELNINLKILPEKKKGQLKAVFSVTTKLPSDKVEAPVFLDDDGSLYADEPNQGQLDLVHDINEKRKDIN